MKKFTFFLSLVLLLAFRLAAQTTLVPYGSTWKYLDNGSDQGTVWRETSFDDASWKSGPAILGYGNPTINNRKESTVVSFGPDPNNTYITTYLRKTISLASAYTSFTASLKRDDGAVVYVNGVEVFRSNMPGGTVAYNTLATYANDNGTNPQTFTIPGSAFTSGNNVIAVEIHQVSNSSSDMTFDLELIGTGGTPTGDQTPPAVLSLNRQAPTTETTSATSVVFRAIFSEAVSGVDATDFSLALGGSATGTIASAAPVGTDGTTYDVTVSSVSGSGTLGLNLNASGTGIADAAGNPIGGGFTGQTYTISQPPTDQTPPAVLSLNRQAPTTETTSATSVVFRAIFSEAVSGVDATDFSLALGGSATGTIASAAPVGTDGTTYDVTVSSVSGSGTLGLNLNASGTGIADAAGNPIGGGFTGQTYTISQPPTDQTPPAVLSLNRQAPTTETTSATSVVFRAIFSEAVSGVDATDFSLALGGSATGTIASAASVGIDGTTYDVTVSSVSGSGTLGLNLNASGTGIADAAGNPIGGGFTGQTYTISQPPTDQTPPAVLSLNRQAPTTETTSATSVVFRGIFSEAVTGVDVTDFALALGGSATGTIASAAPVGTDGTTYDVTVSSVSGSGTLGLNLNASGTGIADAAGNPIGGGFTGQTYNIVQTATTVQSLIPFGSTWKYLDNGSNQGTAWQAVSFNDGSWKTGNGKFGYGYNNEATIISFGPDPTNKYITTYFRKALTIADASAFSSFTGNIKRDDGVVVYVNGVEVYRNNLSTGTISYTTLASSASDNGQTAIPFTINASAFVTGTNVIAVEVHQTSRSSFDMAFDLELIGTGGTPTGDQTPPTVLSLNRQSPTTETTSATSVVFRAIFSEAVTGVDVTDFALALGGSATGTIASAAPVGSDGTAYDVTVSSVSGTGTLGLNLKSSGTGIADAAGNPIGGGFTGQTYTINPIITSYGFASVTILNPITSRVDATKGRPQAKVFTNAGKHWAIIAVSGGTYLFRLDGRSWTNILRVSARNVKADCIVDGNVTHIFLFAGKSSELFSVEYVPETGTYQAWSKRKTKVDLVLDDGVETGTIALDGTGRLWLASDAVTDINVRYSDAPYTTWSSPITIGSGVNSDDICAIIAMPSAGKIGVLWGNQQTKRFGFRTHTDGQSPATWSADEVPASQSALSEGKGMADDHLDIKVTSNGTLYCAVKTGYDKAGFPKIALLVRRPAGTWDNLYGVSEYGTAPIVVVNEALGKVKVVYTSQTYGGDILYKETSTSGISFGAERTLISGINNYATATHQLYSSEVVILAANTEQTSGVLASDVFSASLAMSDDQTARLAQQDAANSPAENQQEIQAFPNPVTSKATIRFALSTDGPYTLTVYDNKMGGKVYQKQGTGKAGEENSIDVEVSRLSGGVYFARLQTNEYIKTLRLLINK